MSFYYSKLQILTRLIFLVALLVLPSCVTTHHRDPVDVAGVLVSCGYGPALASKNIVAMSCTLENKGIDWVQVEVEKVEFDSKASILTPNQLVDFTRAYRAKEERIRANLDIFLGSMALVGAAAMVKGAASNDPAVSRAGVSTAVGAATVNVTRSAVDGFHNSQYGQPVYGAEHLLGESFEIPAGLFVRKSVLIDVGSGRHPSNLSLCLAKPKKNCIGVNLESYRSRRL